MPALTQTEARARTALRAVLQEQEAELRTAITIKADASAARAPR